MLVKERFAVGDWMPPWLRYQHEERYRWAVQYAQGAAVLDAACGIGYGSRMLLDGGAARVIGVDLAFDALQQSGRASNGMRMFLCGSATALPFPPASFDVFVSLETIEHIDDDNAYVEEAARILKPGGTLICSTPNRRLLDPGRTIRDQPFNPFHVREYTEDELRSVLGRRFGEITFFGQTGYRRDYVDVLDSIGRRVPMLAVRVHQLRKLIGMPLERRARHEPVRLPIERREPEVLIAVCKR